MSGESSGVAVVMMVVGGVEPMPRCWSANELCAVWPVWALASAALLRSAHGHAHCGPLRE